MKKIRKFLIKNKKKVDTAEFMILMSLGIVSYILSFNYELIWFVIISIILNSKSRK